MQKSVQVGLLDRYIRICRKSSVPYPPLPITGLKTCLYILKVSPGTTDTSVKERLAVVFDNWRLILLPHFGPQFAGSQSVWTCQALCQVTGRAESHSISSSTGKRKRSLENVNGSTDKNLPLTCLPPQRRRTSVSSVPPINPSDRIPCNRSSDTTIEHSNAQVETQVVKVLATAQSSAVTNTQAPSDSNQGPSLLKSPSHSPNKPGASETEESCLSKALIGPGSLEGRQESNSLQVVRLADSSGNGNLFPPDSNSAEPSCSLSTPSAQAPSPVSDSQVPPHPNSQIAVLSSTSQSVLQESSSSLQLVCLNDVANPTQDVDRLLKPPSATDTSFETRVVPRAPAVQVSYSISPSTSSGLKNWQRACCLFDSALTELLESIPLTAHVPLNAASVYKPKPYSPSFQWTPPAALSHTPPPSLYFMNNPPVLTLKPQRELPVPTLSPSPVSTLHDSHTSTRNSNLIDLEKSPPNISANFCSPDSQAHEELPVPPPPVALSGQVLPQITVNDNQANCSSSGLQSQQGQPPAVAKQPQFHVTEVQKMKFVNTYNRVDATGKAKLEATLKQNNLWEVLSPLLSTARTNTLSNTNMPVTSPLIPSNINPVSLSLNTSVAQSSAITLSPLTFTSLKPGVTAASNSQSTIVGPASFQSTCGSTNTSDTSRLTPNTTQAASRSNSLNNPPHSETALDPTLTIMIKAMLGSDRQTHRDLMMAFETLGIRNKEAIMTHLNSLAVCTWGEDDYMWQLPPELNMTQQPAPDPVARSQSTIDSDSVIKPAEPSALPKSQCDISSPSPDQLSSNNAASFQVISPQISQSSPIPPIEQSSAVVSAHSSNLKILPQPRAVSPEHQQDHAGLGPETPRETLIHDPQVVSEENKEAQEEIEFISPQKKPPRTSPTEISPYRLSPSRTQKSMQSTGDKLKVIQPLLLNPREAKVDFNIFQDGLPGFPDVDPDIQIQGAPAKILGRYPAQQQMPPIRTFVPIMRKVRKR